MADPLCRPSRRTRLLFVFEIHNPHAGAMLAEEGGLRFRDIQRQPCLPTVFRLNNQNTTNEPGGVRHRGFLGLTRRHAV